MLPSKVDRFAADNLPPRAQWPDFRLAEAGLEYPRRLNCVTELLDAHLARGAGGRPAVGTPDQTWSYADLAARVNRIANVLTRDLGMIPGNRVLLRAPNTPMLVAAFLAVMKAGGIAVPTMPLLRAKELRFVVEKARIRLALCDHRLLEELTSAGAERMVPMGGGTALDALMARAPDTFEAWPSRGDETCLIAFTSGTTGVPKGTMHFHRDLLAVCDTYGRHVLRAAPDDVFTGSPPIAFTFGLGAMVLFPLRIGARYGPAGAGEPRTPARTDPRRRRDRLLHRADRLSRHAGAAAAGRHRPAAHLRFGRRGAAGDDMEGVA